MFVSVMAGYRMVLMAFICFLSRPTGWIQRSGKKICCLLQR